MISSKRCQQSRLSVREIWYTRSLVEINPDRAWIEVLPDGEPSPVNSARCSPEYQLQDTEHEVFAAKVHCRELGLPINWRSIRSNKRSHKINAQPVVVPNCPVVGQNCPQKKAVGK